MQLLHMMMGGVYLGSALENATETQCMFVIGCLGENSVERYVRPRCWNHCSILSCYRMSLCLLDILGFPPTSARAKVCASLCQVYLSAGSVHQLCMEYRCAASPFECGTALLQLSVASACGLLSDGCGRDLDFDEKRKVQMFLPNLSVTLEFRGRYSREWRECIRVNGVSE